MALVSANGKVRPHLAPHILGVASPLSLKRRPSLKVAVACATASVSLTPVNQASSCCKPWAPSSAGPHISRRACRRSAADTARERGLLRQGGCRTLLRGDLRVPGVPPPRRPQRVVEERQTGPTRPGPGVHSGASGTPGAAPRPAWQSHTRGDACTSAQTRWQSPGTSTGHSPQVGLSSVGLPTRAVRPSSSSSTAPASPVRRRCQCDSPPRAPARARLPPGPLPGSSLGYRTRGRGTGHRVYQSVLGYHTPDSLLLSGQPRR